MDIRRCLCRNRYGLGTDSQEAGEETAGKVQLYAEYYPAGTRYGTAHKEPQAPGYIKDLGDK